MPVELRPTADDMGTTVLRFLGTRGEIEMRSRAHRRHSSVLLETASGGVMIDCGVDWSAAVWRLAPQAILLTHAHLTTLADYAAGVPVPFSQPPRRSRGSGS